VSDSSCNLIHDPNCYSDDDSCCESHCSSSSSSSSSSCSSSCSD
jgi:hypothetical protein